MHIRRVKYKMSKNDNWRIGYVVRNCEGMDTTLLDKDCRYVPRVLYHGEEYLAYDYKDDENPVNITIL